MGAEYVRGSGQSRVRRRRRPRWPRPTCCGRRRSIAGCATGAARPARTATRRPTPAGRARAAPRALTPTWLPAGETQADGGPHVTDSGELGSAGSCNEVQPKVQDGRHTASPTDGSSLCYNVLPSSRPSPCRMLGSKGKYAGTKLPSNSSLPLSASPISSPLPAKVLLSSSTSCLRASRSSTTVAAGE